MDPSDLLLLTAGKAIFRIVIVLEALYNQVQKDLVANLTLLAHMDSTAFTYRRRVANRRSQRLYAK